MRFEPRQVIVRREDRAAPATPPRGWTHAIEGRRDQRRLARGVERMTIGMHAQIRRAAAIELREKWPEPIGMFVENQKGSGEAHRASPFFGCTTRRNGMK